MNHFYVVLVTLQFEAELDVKQMTTTRANVNIYTILASYTEHQPNSLKSLNVDL